MNIYLKYIIYTHTYIYVCVYILYILKRCFPKNVKLF